MSLVREPQFLIYETSVGEKGVQRCLSGTQMTDFSGVILLMDQGAFSHQWVRVRLWHMILLVLLNIQIMEK